MMHANVKVILSLLLCIFVSLEVFAQQVFDSDALHKPFNDVLMDNVDKGRVNYSGIKADPRFAQYLSALKQAKPETLGSDAEKLAFWINAYNALAIKGILDGLSPSSLFGRYTYFKSTEYEVGGRSINLYDLEREIIIPFNEPRIHFAIVCASYSCPSLRPEAYLAGDLENQLEANTVDFLNDPLKNAFDAKKKRANISQIFDWFEKDFKKHSGSVQKFVATFVNDAVHKEALSQEKYRVKHMKYNWTLNGTPAN